MVENTAKIHNATIKGAGTVDTKVNFDARTVGKIYKRFNNLVKTIRHFIISGEFNAWAKGYTNEELKSAIIEISVDCEDTAAKLKDPVVQIMESTRDITVAGDVELKLVFVTPALWKSLDEIKIEVD